MMSGAAPPDGDRGLRLRLAGTRFTTVRWFDEIDSTNRYAADAATAGLVVVADVQLAGRGRLGRSWHAPPGASLLASVVVGIDDARDALPLVTPAAALAASDALAALAGIDARLKWPNDLVVDERKLAGVLAESVAGGSLVVVGMGLNVAWAAFPDELTDIATSCNLLSTRTVDRAGLVVEWLTRYDALLDQIATRAGRRALRDACATRSATLGRRVRVEMPNHVIEGTATGLLPNGMLEVTGDDGAHTIAAGDVVHLRSS